MSFNESRYSLFLNIINGSTHAVMEIFENQKLGLEILLNKFDWTPLHTAAYKGNIQLVEYLLSKGANLEAINKSGYTPQMLAAMNGHHEIDRLLSLKIDAKKEKFIEVKSYLV